MADLKSKSNQRSLLKFLDTKIFFKVHFADDYLAYFTPPVKLIHKGKQFFMNFLTTNLNKESVFKIYQDNFGQ